MLEQTNRSKVIWWLSDNIRLNIKKGIEDENGDVTPFLDILSLSVCLAIVAEYQTLKEALDDLDVIISRMEGNNKKTLMEIRDAIAEVSKQEKEKVHWFKSFLTYFHNQVISDSYQINNHMENMKMKRIRKFEDEVSIKEYRYQKRLKEKKQDQQRRRNGNKRDRIFMQHMKVN